MGVSVLVTESLFFGMGATTWTPSISVACALASFVVFWRLGMSAARVRALSAASRGSISKALWMARGRSGVLLGATSEVKLERERKDMGNLVIERKTAERAGWRHQAPACDCFGRDAARTRLPARKGQLRIIRIVYENHSHINPRRMSRLRKSHPAAVCRQGGSW